MKYNVWYKAPAGIWVNGCECEEKDLPDRLKKYIQMGYEVKAIPQDEPSED